MGKIIFKYNEVNPKYFIDNYDLVWTNLLNDNQTILIDDKNNTCRFCGRSKNEVKFSDKCHAVPEFLGNKKIITKNECNNCNHKYASILEDDLSKFTLPTRLLTRVYGKRGIPEYKNKSNNSHMNFKDTFKVIGDESFVKIDKKNKKIQLKFDIQTFTPIKVYKALVRIALNCLPKVYFDKFKLINWLENDKDLNGVTEFYTTAINLFIPTIAPSFNLCLFIRKNNTANVPYCQMVLQFNNNFIQIIIPFLNEDKHLENVSEVLIYPFYIFNKKQDNIKVKLINLSDRNKRKLSQTYSMSFINIIPANPED